jgi:hypothetical protein
LIFWSFDLRGRRRLERLFGELKHVNIKRSNFC